jgi:very-short-patch-repair endonuclease
VGQIESEIEQVWLQELKSRGLFLPTLVHETVGRCQARPDFFYQNGGLAVYVDGDHQEREKHDATLAVKLENEGYMVLRFGERGQWDGLFEEYQDIFGGKV